MLVYKAAVNAAMVVASLEAQEMGLADLSPYIDERLKFLLAGCSRPD